MRYPINWGKDSDIRRLFSYQTRVGLAPKFGTCCISYYQQDQCHVYDEIIKRAKNAGHSAGDIEVKHTFKSMLIEGEMMVKVNGKWVTIGGVRAIREAAEKAYYK